MAPANVQDTKRRSQRSIQLSRPRHTRTVATTYARRLKAIPLQGQQFGARDPYDLPSDGEDEAVASWLSPTQPGLQLPDPDDSPLSEDELAAAYGSNVTTEEPRSTRTKATKPKRAASEGNSGNDSIAKRRKKRTGKKDRVHAICAADPQTRITRSQRSHPGLHRNLSTQERLQVNKLVMVSSLPRDPPPAQPLREAPGIDAQDPIECLSHDASWASDSAFRQNSDNPVASTDRSIRTTRFKSKSALALQKKRKTKIQSEPQLGDGFQITELNIDRVSQSRKIRVRSRPLMLGFTALTLCEGPLPDVKFENTSIALEMRAEVQNAESIVDDVRGLQTDEQQMAGGYIWQDKPIPDAEYPSSNPPGAQGKVHQVSSADRARQQRISQQLSSISAPKRAYSISSDDDSHDDQEVEPSYDEDSSGDVNHHEDRRPRYSLEEEDDVDDEVDLGKRAPAHGASKQQARSTSNLWSRTSSPPPLSPVENYGVHLDFRKVMRPGLVPPSTTLGKRRLVEVDESIYDEPSQDLWLTSSQVHESEDEMLDDEPQKLTSILKNTAFPQRAADTRPEATAANTRRNSMITLDDDSHYVATAMDMVQRSADYRMLRVPKHRSSQLRRSSYFDRDLETSPEPPDPTGSSQLDVLRQSADAARASSRNVPNGPRDLAALTRSVSREHGTLSQSIRRRSSLLPFHSPTKVQRA